MVNRFKILIVIVIVVFNFTNVIQSEKLKQIEYDLIDNLLSNIGINVPIDSTLLYKNFCFYPGLSCVTTTETKLSSIDLMGKPINSLMPSSFIGYTSLESLTLSTFTLTPNFLAGTFPNSLKTLKVKLCTSFLIGPIYSSITHLEIDLGMVTDVDVQMSYLSNLNKFILTDSTNQFSSSKIQFINDFPSLKTFTSLFLTIPNIPLMKNINILEGITIHYVGSLLDTNSINNIASFKDLTCTVMFFGDAFIDFPFTSTFKPNYFRTTFKFNTPNNYIDTSQWETDYLSFENVGTSFNIDGNLPFSKLPNPTGLFYFNKGSLTRMPDFPLLLSNTITQFQKIDLQFNNIPQITKWEKLNGKVDILNIGNNEMTGIVDPSFCELKLNVSYNKLTGYIPSCFTCYFQYDSALYYGFGGNSFDNYIQSTPCETIVPNLYYENSAGRLWLFGNDLGFGYGNKIVTSPVSITNWVLAINSNKYYADIPLSSITTNILSFTFQAANGGQNKVYKLAVQQQTPIVNSIEPVYSTISNQILISGENFSYNTSVIQVYFNDLQDDNICIVTKSTFNEITCNIKSKSGVFTSLNRKVTISVSVNEIKAVNLGACKSLCNVEGKCNVDQGTDNEGTCECSPDKTCNGNGVCNGTDSCVCLDGFSGKGCFYQPHFVSSYQSVSVKGGEVQLKGFFSNYHLDLRVLIGGNECPVSYAGRDYIQCTIGPGSGVQPIIVYQNGLKWYDDTMFQYLNDPTIPLTCLNDCTSLSNGECNTLTGICKCKNGWSSYDCSLKDSPTQPNTTVNVITGTTKFNSDLINFDISLYKLLEVDINGNTVDSFPLENNWFANIINVGGDLFNKIYLFNQSLQINQSNIIYKLEEIPNDKEIEFAGVQFNIKGGSIKTSVSIYNYKFKNSLNTLKLSFKSSVQQNAGEETCNNESSNTEIENISNNQNLNYLSIKKGGKILSSRFINRILSDGSSTFITITITKNETDPNQVMVTCNLPHCVSHCEMDPDYSVLVSSDFKENCNDNDNNRKWVIPVAVVVSVVGASALVILGYLIYKRHNVAIKVGVAQLKQIKK